MDVGVPPLGGFGPPPGGGSEGPRVAWEDKSLGFFTRWWNTWKAVSFNPTSFFEAASVNEDPWPAVTFAIATSVVTGLAVGGFLALTYSLLGASAVSANPASAGDNPAAVFSMMMGLGVFSLVMYPAFFAIIALIGPWIGGGVQHVCLSILGGVSRPYTSTVRVVAYSYAAQAWSILPIVGGILSAIFSLISHITGLAAVHRCSQGKAALAIFLPVILLCGCCCFAWSAIGGLGAFLGAGSGHHP